MADQQQHPSLTIPIFIPQDDYERTLLSLIPPDSHLQKALSICPDVVRTDTDPLLFLRFEQYNVRRAAVRLTSFWNARVRVFGPHRAFRSLTDDLSGRGALQSPALDLVLSGVAIILPEKDADGYSTLFWDRSMVPSPVEKVVTVQHRLQVAFYNYSVMMKSNADFCMIYRPFWKPTPAFMQGSLDLLKVFPFRLHRTHALVEVASHSSQSLRMYFMTTFARMVISLRTGIQITLDVGTREELKEKLLSYGYSIDNLPEAIGGTSLVHHFFSEWATAKVTAPSTTSTATTTRDNSSRHTETTTADKESCEALLLLASAAEERDSTSNTTSDTVSATSGGINRITEASPMQTTITTQNEPTSALALPDLSQMPSYARAIHLSAEEASWTTFFALEGGDSVKATERTEEYWSFRQLAFQERSRCPLHLSPGGALSPTDLQVLECGYVTLLPPDAHGQSVVCCDPSRLERDYTEECLRCFWFMLLAAASEQKQQQQQQTTLGPPAPATVVLLVVMNKLSFERSRWHSDVVKLLRLAPIRLSVIHVVRQPARLGEKTFDHKVIPVLRDQFAALTETTSLQFHSGTRGSSLMDQLQPQGFSKQNLPRSLGGGWSYEHFLQWRQGRERQDAARI